MAKGVLDGGEGRNASTRAYLRGDVTVNVLAALEKFEESGHWDNYRLLEPLIRQVEWFTPEEDLVRQILDTMLAYCTGGGRKTELKLREFLDLSKHRKWTNAKRAASRALASLSHK